jgi:hypothetical protein
MDVRTPRRVVMPVLAVIVLLSLQTVKAAAQEGWPPRVSAETVASARIFSSDEHVSGIFDATVAVETGKGLTGIARPWFFRRPNGTSTFQWYQLQLRYQTRTRFPVRLDAGVITSPLGLSTLQQRSDLNPTISPVFYYVTSLPRFDLTFDGLQTISAGYPLGAIVTTSGGRWDVRGGVTNSTPARSRAELKRNERPAMPQLVLAGGVTPRAGMRIGLGLAHGRYRDATASSPAGYATVFNLEGEYAFNHTRLSGEWIRDSFGTTLGSETARAFYLQGVQTITPRIFGAARVAHRRSPPLFPPPRIETEWTTVELTAGYRLTRDWTMRAGYYRQRAYPAPDWDNQAAASIVWARRWY